MRDSGVGFDMEDAANTPRLGLAIMKERMKLVKGEFSVQSQRERGTTIQACVPLHPTIPPRQPDNTWIIRGDPQSEFL